MAVQLLLSARPQVAPGKTLEGTGVEKQIPGVPVQLLAPTPLPLGQARSQRLILVEVPLLVLENRG